LDPTDHLIAKVGIGIVDTVERYYQKYLAKPNDTNARSYCLWRLRLHRRLKNDKSLLKAINEAPLATTTKPFDTRRGERVKPTPEMATAQATK
jgi:hypothetical protein